LKRCELELVQEVKNVWCYREPKPRLEVLGANGYKVSWRIGCVAARSGDIYSAVHWEMELPSASPHLVELGFRGESPKNLLSLAPFSDLPRS